MGSNNLIELLNDADTKNEFLIRDKGLNSRIARSINKVQDLDTLHCDLVTRRKINDEKISNKKISYEISNKYSVGDNIKVGSNEFKIEDIEPVYVVKKTSEEGQ